MKVEKKILSEMKVNSYILSNEGSNKVILVDPGADANEIIEYLEDKNYVPTHILLTHGHFDHARQLDVLKKRYDVKVIAYKDAQIVLNDERHNLCEEYTGVKMNCDLDIALEDNEVININGLDIRLLLIGGHTIDSSCYYIASENVIFTGDSLFFRTVGRTDLYMSDGRKQIKKLKEKVLVLPDEVVIYPGHGKNSMISDEKKNNLFIGV